MFYQVNHHAFMAHAKSVLALKSLWSDALVGSSFAFGPSYAKSDKPADAMAKMDYDDLQSYYWMDVYAYGRYPRAAIAQLKSEGVAPVLEEGDEEILKEAAALVDFMGVNYYQTCVAEFNPIDGVGMSNTMNTTGKRNIDRSGHSGTVQKPAERESADHRLGLDDRSAGPSLCMPRHHEPLRSADRHFRKWSWRL